MQRFIIILVSMIFINSMLYSQYRVNKKIYDYHNYSYQSSDKYNPAGVGVASFFIPGLGQMISGEPGRGLIFLGSYAGSITIYMAGLIRTVDVLGSGISGEEVKPGGPAMIVAGAAGTLSVMICSVIDAVRVAKVNNLALRDQKKTSQNFQIQPNFNVIYPTNGSAVASGLSMRVIF